MTFQRARSEAQRDQRRQTILDTAITMLGEMPVADITLNEISRRVGLAKSNVMRYYETREAILLTILDSEFQACIQQLQADFTGLQGTPPQRAKAMASLLATALASRPMLCDLISAQAAVLERNISPEVALHHKRTSAGAIDQFSDLLGQVFPELSLSAIHELIALTILTTAAGWAYSRPSLSVQAAFQTDPALAAHQFDFAGGLERLIQVHLLGLLADAG